MLETRTVTLYPLHPHPHCYSSSKAGMMRVNHPTESLTVGAPGLSPSPCVGRPGAVQTCWWSLQQE